jgi:4-carboxymuconolactone decarboxylase
MRLKTPRIPPTSTDDWSAETAQVFRGQQMRGRVANIFLTMANHEKLAKRWLVFGNHILSKSTLPPRDREIVILRMGWLCQSAYEWGQHRVIGKAAGLTDEEISSIKEGPDATSWGSHDANLLRATDELHDNAFIADETWEALAQDLSDQQMMDLVFTCGQYNMVCMALNSFGVQLDDDIEGF